jgi:5'-phosphate synthase pdxT subunit
MVKIGVLALQGDFSEHLGMLKRIGVEALEVRLPNQLQGLEGLIIPGGESTTIGKLATAYGLMQPLREFGRDHAIWVPVRAPYSFPKISIATSPY